MECPYCDSINIKTLKVHISRPIGAKKCKCLQCNRSFITNNTRKFITNNRTKNNNLIQVPHENDKIY